MSKISHRPDREEIKAQKKKQKQKQKLLRCQQNAAGFVQPEQKNINNITSKYETVDEERQGRINGTVEQVRIFRSQLPVLLKRLTRISDPRNPKKIKHKLTVLIIYGILTFVYQMSSRREANRKMTRPMFIENLQLLFPELESIPHHDTLIRNFIVI